MRQVLGTFNPERGEGQLRPVTFTQLMLMDDWTGDDRRFLSEGGGSRELPLSIHAQTATAPGHNGAVIVGSLQEVTIDGKVMSGRGWLADTPFVRNELMPLLASKSLRHNSVDLADATVIMEWKSDDPNDPGYNELALTFPTWRLAATTMLSVGAFPNARFELDDELVASMCADESPLVIEFDSTEYTIGGRDYDELTASMTVTEVEVSWDDFHIPENPDAPTPICVDKDGRVFGNLADWSQPHAATGEFCPRPSTYDNFHKDNAVITDRGPVATGPIFFLNGHPDENIGNGDPNKAYGGVENAWCDVVVTNGKWGPWISGHVRPGLSANALYVARASKISGHWTKDRTKLLAIVSVNQGAFHVPNSKLSFDKNSAVLAADGHVLELVASLRTPRLSPEEQAGEMVGKVIYNTMSSRNLSDNPSAGHVVMRGGQIDAEGVTKLVLDRLEKATSTAGETVTLSITETTDVTIEVSDDEAEQIAIELELDEIDDELAFGPS